MCTFRVAVIALISAFNFSLLDNTVVVGPTLSFDTELLLPCVFVDLDVEGCCVDGIAPIVTPPSPLILTLNVAVFVGVVLLLVLLLLTTPLLLDLSAVVELEVDMDCVELRNGDVLLAVVEDAAVLLTNSGLLKLGLCASSFRFWYNSPLRQSDDCI